MIFGVHIGTIHRFRIRRMSSRLKRLIVRCFTLNYSVGSILVHREMGLRDVHVEFSTKTSLRRIPELHTISHSTKINFGATRFLVLRSTRKIARGTRAGRHIVAPSFRSESKTERESQSHSSFDSSSKTKHGTVGCCEKNGNECPHYEDMT